MILGALAATKNAAAEPGSPCRVRFVGNPSATAWTQAKNQLEERVAQLSASTTDCRLVVVTPEAQGASVEFTTVDQRVARRHIASPGDLLPLVEALLVFGHDPLSIAPPAPEKSAEVLAMPEEPPGNDVASEDAASIDATPARGGEPVAGEPNERVARARPDAPRVLVGAGAGVKASFPNDSVAGVGQIFVGMTLARWELAGFGRWELEHDAHDAESESATKGKLRYSAIGGGAMFGRRQPLGPLVLIGGARAAVYGAEQERVGGPKVDGRSTHKSENFLDPRVGLYAGCVVSESSRLRVRVQVDGDLGLVEHRAELADLGTFPRWNVGLSLGAEAGFLP